MDEVRGKRGNHLKDDNSSSENKSPNISRWFSNNFSKNSKLEVPQHEKKLLGTIGQDLLLRMLDPDPNTRISFLQIWQHAWWAAS
jgi:serine/threonine protein kinase